MASGKKLAECKREAQSQTTYVRYLSLKGELLTELPRAARALNSQYRIVLQVNFRFEDV
jgi:hypothetical protein